MGFRIVVAADSAGVDYKEILKKDLEADPRVDEVIDAGLSSGEDVDYPHVAVEAARIIAGGKADRGLFVCGTGMGVAMAANKVPGIRASVAHDSFSVERLVKSNNAQVLTFGQRVIGLELARKLTNEWLGYEFDPSSHSAPKVAALDEYDREHSVESVGC
ncbi:ribose-5-phosphate isomerase [Schaalia sp. ZJ405]|uniref:ribose-5-phosphate isomerase n=1 Tax=unclassified Schaalia TaxID=2691889 RepID=UPI0013EB7CE7|nr:MULTISPECIES: ribose-5-phosphate isomerase [unclassified Schaalia]QPK80895.1 ribose-5-phosphate isomerase [Schaalia sp. ZJ405]